MSTLVFLGLVGCVTFLAVVQPTTAYFGSMYRNREALRPEYEDELPASFRPGIPMPRTGMWYQQRRSASNNGVQQNEDDGQEMVPSCQGLACRSNDGCCEAMVCKLPEVDAKKAPAILPAPVGTCIPNPNEGTACKLDAGCGYGMECVLTAGARGFKTCQPKSRDVSRKQFNDDCRQSAECDQSRGLCCQIHRRHRQAPRQVCLYYKEMHNCIGFRKEYMPDVQDVLANMKNKWWQY